MLLLAVIIVAVYTDQTNYRRSPSLSVCLPVYFSVCLSVLPSLPPSSFSHGWQDGKIQQLTLSLSVSPSPCLSLYVSVSISLCLCLGVKHQVTYLLTYLPAYCVCFCLFVCLSACLSPTLPTSLTLEFSHVAHAELFLCKHLFARFAFRSWLHYHESQLTAATWANKCCSLVSLLFVDSVQHTKDA